MKEFVLCPAYQKLQQLAKHPFDLRSASALSTERFFDLRTVGPLFTLLYPFQQVTSETVEVLCELARERGAVEKMQDMQRGAIVNEIVGVPSEKRAVLHTAVRDIFGVHAATDKASEIRVKAAKEHQKLKVLCQQLEQSENTFENLIVLGIGGSQLGPQAILEGLSFYRRPQRNVYFVSNIDPDNMALVLAKSPVEKSLFVVVSKSGTTLETTTNEQIIRRLLQERNCIPKDHFVSISMPNTPLDNSEKYRACLHLFDVVGGRFSSSSVVGTFILAYACGIDVVEEFLRGAHEMDQAALVENPKNNLPLMLALLGVWNRNFLRYPTVAIVPYSQVLHRFPAHLQQCDMESNGKRIDRYGHVLKGPSGPVVWGEPGTSAQHSFFQLLHQGTDIVPVEFIGFQEPQGGRDWNIDGTTSQEKLLANLFAQAVALAKGAKSDNPNKEFPGNRPSLLLMAKSLTPKAIGALLALYEHKVAFQGFIWGINSFDQEGVQLGKRLADGFIDNFKSERDHSKKRATVPGPAAPQVVDDICFKNFQMLLRQL